MRLCMSNMKESLWGDGCGREISSGALAWCGSMWPAWETCSACLLSYRSDNIPYDDFAKLWFDGPAANSQPISEFCLLTLIPIHQSLRESITVQSTRTSTKRSVLLRTRTFQTTKSNSFWTIWKHGSTINTKPAKILRSRWLKNIQGMKKVIKSKSFKTYTFT